MRYGMAPQKESFWVYEYRFPLKIRHGFKIYAEWHGTPKKESFWVYKHRFPLEIWHGSKIYAAWTGPP